MEASDYVVMWCGQIGKHAAHELHVYGRCVGTHEQFRENQWGEPSGPEMMERGDHVLVRAGSTSGVVIGVTLNRMTGTLTKITFVMDRPEQFLQSRAPHELDVLRKVVR